MNYSPADLLESDVASADFGPTIVLNNRSNSSGSSDAVIARVVSMKRFGWVFSSSGGGFRAT